ncbi:MAG TPA: alpha-2-macroglobulin family protein [Thermomicrobiales bacterium]|nr:alpha-2-macroglobulin family protein [Thermomicrobiales bacterium]
MASQARQVLSRRGFLAATAGAAAVIAGAGFGVLRHNGPAPAATPTTAAGGPGATPGATPGGTPMGTAQVAGRADGYIAVAPGVLRAGQSEDVSVALFAGDQPTRGAATVALLRDGRSVAQGTGQIAGRGTVALAVPRLPAGDYQLRVSGDGFADQAAIRVEDGTLLFLETDKPIYQPGQTVHIRALALDPALKPAPGDATVEVMDAKGLKVYKKALRIDDYGMATTDLPLSTEPNLGTWKIRATMSPPVAAGGAAASPDASRAATPAPAPPAAGAKSAQLDVRVERYVLPKYEVTVDLPKAWVLVNETLAGTVAAAYTFGKPVRGEVEIAASRYVGTWQEYARVSRPLDGKLAFEVPPVRYAAGTPGAGGLGQVRLAVTVREEATGYEEETERLVTVAASPVNVQLVPEGGAFRPGLPFTLLVNTAAPDGKPVDADVRLRLNYLDANYQSVGDDTAAARTHNGAALVRLAPPGEARLLQVEPAPAGAPLTLRAGYSPSGAFIHVTQTTPGPLQVGDTARFTVAATTPLTTVYYEVLARGTSVFSEVAHGAEIAVPLSPLMAPEGRLLVYQLLPSGEVAADWLPFTVAGDYPQQVTVGFDRPEVKPGDAVDVRVQTEGPAKVGLVGVDRAVYILAENRLNLQQVFDELERLYLQPRAEPHDGGPGPVPPPGIPRPAPGGVVRPGGAVAPDFVAPGMPPAVPAGARETFRDAGVLILTNRTVPTGQDAVAPRYSVGAASPAAAAPRAALAAPNAAGAAPTAAAAQSAADAPATGLAEVQRVRQFFPETWLWADLTTDGSGKAAQRATAPDSITTWAVRAVALSKDKGLGIGDAELRVFQPFFVQIDLPYSTIRGEEFPVKVALYNYAASAQDFRVELDAAGWFTALDDRVQQVRVEANGVGAASFTIRPGALGVNQLKITARGPQSADAIVKDLIVEPEGVAREEVQNLVLTPGAARALDLATPPNVVAGSHRAYVALTGNMLSQTIDGLDGLLQMPYGCGEQNMILFAPDVFIARYLAATGQLKPEVMAKAELLMLTGYQRELTYRHDDGSFSAFGQQDQVGSLWLTAFVLKTFAQARDLVTIDDMVLSSAGAWIARQQAADGSFDPVGFVHHQELLGGLTGKTALTAFVALALLEAGAGAPASRAVRYLEGRLDATADAYALAIAAYALALAKSTLAGRAHDKLIAIAHQDENGIYWGDEPRPQPLPAATPAPGQPAQPGAIPGPGPLPPRPVGRAATIETTGYATLALLQGGDRLTASRAVRWLASRRNARGGFGSTQDTVVALQALTAAATANRADVDATVALTAGSWRKEVRVAADNADTVQIVETPVGAALNVASRGRGEVLAQLVSRYNLPAAATPASSAFQLDVQYSADQVAVNDLITVTATVRFTPRPRSGQAPPEQYGQAGGNAGMVVLDVAVPTGFAPEQATLDALPRREPKLKRWDIAGRKVIFYIEDLAPGETLTLAFQARALYPVRAQAVTSQVYAYYQPELRGESLGGQLVVGAGAR